MFEVLSFSTARSFRAWLRRSHRRSPGILLRIYKKASGVATVTYDQALDQALCFGWIDGLRLPHDDESYLQRFTPRRPRSKWSKRNTGHIARLTAAGEMAEAGLREVRAAKADGRWAAAYDSPANIKLPPEFTRLLARNPKARAFYKTLSRANFYAIAYRLQDAKRAETRQRRMQQIIAMLARGETFR